MSITHEDPVAAFLADRPECGLSPAVYAAAKAEQFPELEYRATADHLDPDPRELAVETVLANAGSVDEAVTVLRGFRPDLTTGEVRGWLWDLLDQASEVARARWSGRGALVEMQAARYDDMLSAFCRPTAVTR